MTLLQLIQSYFPTQLVLVDSSREGICGLLDSREKNLSATVEADLGTWVLPAPVLDLWRLVPESQPPEKVSLGIVPLQGPSHLFFFF